MILDNRYYCPIPTSQQAFIQIEIYKNIVNSTNILKQAYRYVKKYKNNRITLIRSLYVIEILLM